MAVTLSPQDQLVDVIRRLVEDERISAARTVLAREAAETVRVGDLATWSKVLAEPRAVSASNHGRDRTADYGWLLHNAHLYRGEWVAIADGELLAHAVTLRELLHALAGHELKAKALVHKIR